MAGLPENFDLLASGEDKIRTASMAAISDSFNLSLHARMALQVPTFLLQQIGNALRQDGVASGRIGATSL
jgi:hypothetical protein